MGGPAWASDGTAWGPYAAAVERAGGEAVHLGAGVRGHESRVLADLQAILFSGGNDIDLALYPNPPHLNGEDPQQVMQRFRMTPEADRDAYELPLIREALQRD